MLNTLSECNKELSRIDSELERLNLERNHILEVKKILQKRIPIITEKNRQQILRLSKYKQILFGIIQNNPGMSGTKIFELWFEIYPHSEKTRRQLSMGISDMRQAGYIENQGTHGAGARWYIKELV